MVAEDVLTAVEVAGDGDLLDLPAFPFPFPFPLVGFSGSAFSVMRISYTASFTFTEKIKDVGRS